MGHQALNIAQPVLDRDAGAADHMLLLATSAAAPPPARPRLLPPYRCRSLPCIAPTISGPAMPEED